MRIIRNAMAAVCIAVPMAAMLGMGCGLFTMPVDGTSAALTNATSITLQLELVDEAGVPLDDVKVEVVRHALDTNVIFPGKYDKRKPDPPKTVSRTFHYDSLGNCAVEVTYSKPGYATQKHLYARVDAIHPSPAIFVGIPQDYPCENINTHPPRRIVMQMAAATQAETQPALPG